MLVVAEAALSRAGIGCILGYTEIYIVGHKLGGRRPIYPCYYIGEGPLLLFESEELINFLDRDHGSKSTSTEVKKKKGRLITSCTEIRNQDWYSGFNAINP